MAFLHGLFHGFTHLREHALPAPNRSIVLDLLGYGAYAHVAHPVDLVAQVEHVIAELDREGLARAHWVGHSVGGALAMLVAARHPNRVASLVNVEGNFTLADAFWSSKIAQMSIAEVEVLLTGYRNDVAGWLERMTIQPTPQRIEWTRRMFDAQPATVVHATARSVVEVTGRDDYLEQVDRVFDLGVPVHLFAGERSRGGWNVPDFALRRAASFTTQPAVGHMMPVEDLENFLALLAGLVIER